MISIHAPRTGSDDLQWMFVDDTSNFNPRSPHGERLNSFASGLRLLNFNPRSPHGERLRTNFSTDRNGIISIHAPRTGSDDGNPSWQPFAQFQSTLPARGATGTNGALQIVKRISIHAPRTGSDGRGTRPMYTSSISIHAPRTGSDQALTQIITSRTRFQSTLPARGATLLVFWKQL